MLLGVAGLVTVVVQWVVSAVDVPVESNVASAAGTWTAVLGTAVLACAVLATGVPRWVRSLVVVVALTATATALLAWPLHGTSYYFGGLISDQEFRTQYLTRLTDSAALADMSYPDLPPFYPAGWFWPAGRIAALSGLEAWAAYKPIALATVGLTPALVFCVWERLVSWRPAVAIAGVTLVLSISLVATEPYSWPVAALLPPAAVHFWRQMSRSAGPSLRGFVPVGLYLGLGVSTYTLYALFAAVLFCVLAVVHVLTRRRERRTASLRESVVGLTTVAVTASVIALLAWSPFLLQAVHSGLGDNHAARFLPTSSTELPGVLHGDPWGLLLIAGLVALLARLCGRSSRHSSVFTPLLVGVGCAYGWYGLSTAAVLAHTTLLSFRIETVLVLCLGIAGVLATAELGPVVAAALARHGLAARRLGVAAGVLVVLATTQVVTDRSEDLEPRVEQAYSTPYPSGADALGRQDAGREEGWSDALAAEISRLTSADAHDLVVLTTNYSLLSFQPYRSFQEITPHYANPLADYPDRTAYLEDLAASSSTGELLTGLDAATWTPPTVFVLGVQPDGLHLRLCRDVFPADPNVQFFDVVFGADLFASPAFTTAEVGPYLIAVRRTPSA
ncbi:arabinofuranosyltransferase [Modestobacter excelsi]|uniref:arabinofuranosyltransferase n=1 Tax=Modestobacter excelsi TaxID=2213161 RepID=UPI001C20EB25|nr:arabinofuranosyltransferase [Modestobacter excelsi]